MPLGINQTKTALIPFTTASFLAFGGVPPYSYSVVAGGAGGTIDVDGNYTAPNALNVQVNQGSLMYDVIQVTDSTPVTPLVATTKILVGNALQLFCEIIAKRMNLAQEKVFLWNQKNFQPKDPGIYVAVDIQNQKMVANNISQSPDDPTKSVQYCVNVCDADISVISRGPDALFQKEAVAMALRSQYSENQQTANSFKIGRIPPAWRDLSAIDGAAIPYRFMITVRLGYAVFAEQDEEYFDTFRTPMVITDVFNPYLLDNDQQFVFDNGGDPLLKS